MLKGICSKIGCLIKNIVGDVKVESKVIDEVNTSNVTSAAAVSDVTDNEKTERDLEPVVEAVKEPVSIKIHNPIYEYAHGRKFKEGDARWIVVHYTACINLGAKSMCKVMKSNTGASSHFYIDEKDIYAAVPLKYVAWHVAGGKCNQPKKGVEMTLEQLAKYKANDWRYDLAASNHLKWKENHDDFAGNYYSIGVDMCVKKKQKNDKNKATDLDWYFEEGTVENTAKTVAYLANEYHIDIDHIIRHGDATGKLCPQPYTYPFDEGDKKWAEFKNKVSEYMKCGVNARWVKD